MSGLKPSIAVIGGGVAGLSAVWYLNQFVPQAKVYLFEETSRTGGKVITHFLEGSGQQPFVLEAGADAFLAKQKPWAYELALGLGLGERLLPTQAANSGVYVVNRGALLPLPRGLNLILPNDWEAFVQSPLVSAAGQARMAQEREIPAVDHEGDESVADFVTRRLGVEALEKLAEPLMSGIYSAHPEEQSILATFPRFRQMESQYGSLLRAMEMGRQAQGATPAGAASTGPVSTFVSFLDGTEELPKALAAQIKATVYLNSPVEAIAQQDAGFQIHGGAGTKTVDAVVLAIPARPAASLLRLPAPAAAAELEHLRTVSSGVIYLGFRRDQIPHPLDGSGVVIPRAEKRNFNALTWVSSKFAHRAPEGHALIRLFFGGARSPHMMERDDTEIAQAARRELSDLLGVEAPPQFARVFRWWHAQPQYDVGHLERMDRIDQALPAGLRLIGTAYGGVGIPDCVHQGRAAAQSLAAYLCRP